MDDFNNKYENENKNAETPVNETPAEPQAQQPNETAPQQTETPQAQQQPQSGEEPRTPFQTPVQHPEYQSPRERSNAQQFQSSQQPPVQQTPQQQNGIPYSDAWHQQNQQSAMPHRSRKSGRRLVIGLCSVAAACLLFAGGAVATYFVTGSSQTDSSASASTDSGSTPTMQINSKPSDSSSSSSDGMSGEDIYKKVSPSVVSVISTTSEGQGSGSGVIMSSDGYIITNNHVVEGAQSVSVQLNDGTSLDATIVGTDEQTDLAVIKVNSSAELTAAEFGDSDELQPGEYAYAIGSPGGVQFANTITGGRISAINRDLTVNDRVMSLIQTDASINNGNSGGALINEYGQVVGITSAKLSGNAFGSATVEGMGFAIPINTAKDIVDEIIQNGYVSGRPSIGITGRNVSSQDGSISGVQVYSIDSRAKAASEVLKVGDVITAVNGTPTPTMDEVNTVKADKKAGDKLTLSVYRISEDKTINLTITLTDAHDLEGDDPAETQQQNQSQNDNSGNYGNYGNGYGSFGGFGGFSSPFSSFGW